MGFSNLTRLAILSLSLITETASAGWSSGGGQILKDAQNPWFIQNTTQVSICVIWDRQHFDIGDRGADFLHDKIQQSLAYWRQEFSRSFAPAEVVVVARQDFRITKTIVIDGPQLKESCAPDTDLTFQFGYLNGEQIKYFADNGERPNDFAAITIRTDYDKVNLKGRGFIYVGADSGALKFVGPNLVDHPWRLGSGGLLLGALKHELGHVFGLQHSSNFLMSAGFLEQILKTDRATGYAHSNIDFDFFEIIRDGTVKRYCPQGFAPTLLRFLEVNHRNDRCYNFVRNQRNIEFWLGATAEELRQVGTLQLGGKQTFSWIAAVKLYMPDEQQVIKNCHPSACDKPWVLGPMIKLTEISGTYFPKNGGPGKQMIAKFSPLGIGDNIVTFSGLLDGIIHSNLEWGH